jgi:uncharacterized phage protein gp47/JayE
VAKYITLPIDTDPEDLIEDAYAYLTGKVPGWEPADGNLDTWIIQALSSAAAESRDVASAVPDSIFRFFGDSLVSLPPIDASPATATTTWTMIDAAGYTIEAGTQLGIRTAGDDLVPFYVQNTVVIPAGSTVTAAGAVTIVAVEAGADASGLGAPGGTLELIDPLNFVLGITQVGVTSGGVDAEDDQTYLDRLRTFLQLMTPRPILPQDFAVFARNIAGVYRAVAIDGYDPGTLTYGNARTITIAMMDEAGNPVSAPVKAAVDADLQARREVNFLIYEIDPTTSLIDVTYVIHIATTYEASDVIARVNSALSAYLNPATWGSPPDGDPRDWSNITTIRYLELAQVINNVSGVDYIISLNFGISGGAMAGTDVNLPGVAPVPRADDLVGSVV